jgi:hypothetical protein
VWISSTRLSIFCRIAMIWQQIAETKTTRPESRQSKENTGRRAGAAGLRNRKAQWTGPTQTQPNPGNSSWSDETHRDADARQRQRQRRREKGSRLPALPPSVARWLWLAGWLPHRSIIGAWIIIIIVLCCNFMGIMG